MTTLQKLCSVLIMALLLVGASLHGATGTLSPIPYLTVLDSAGNPVSGSCTWTYVAGTSTPATTWTDKAESTPNSNPIVADGAGRFVAYLNPGNSYKFVTETACTFPAHGAVIRTQDNIDAVPISSTALDTQGTAGETLTTGQAVYLSDGSGGKTVGLWYVADSANTYSSTTPAIGLATAGATASTVVTIRLSGFFPGLSALTVGGTYYVGTAGNLTTTAPANYRIVGQAQTATTIIVSPGASGVASASNLVAGTVPVPRLASGVTTLITTVATGTQNNWAPGLSGNTIILVGGAAPLTITGFAGGVAGQEVTVINVGTSTAIFKYIDAGSSVGNKLLTLTQSDMTLATPIAFNGSARFIYDTATNRWQMLSFVQGDPIAWTPTLQFGGASVGLTYTTRNGAYWIEGNTIYFSGRVTLSARGASAGSASISGLPVAAQNNTASWGRAIFSYFTSSVGLQNGMNGYITASTAAIILVTPADAGTGVASVTEANFNNTTDLVFSGSYVIN